MEKRSPHSTLERVKELVEEGRVRITQTARSGAAAMGFSFSEIISVVMALQYADFFTRA